MKNLIRRFSSVPIASRYYQLVNGIINAACGGSMQILHVIEYPRCGGSWIRHIMQDAMDIQQYAYDRLLTRNTIIQCHSLPNWQIRRPVVLFRDPRDSLVSFYHKMTSFDKTLTDRPNLAFANYRHDVERPVQEDFADFLESHLIEPQHPRFTFHQFAKQWMDQQDTCVVRYENFKTNPRSELKKIVEFANWEIGDEELIAAIEKNSFENRTKMRSGKSRKPGESDVGQFERKGIIGDWKNLFNQRAKETFLKYEGETLCLLGYEQDTSWAN